MKNYVLEEDWVPGLLGVFAGPSSASSSTDGDAPAAAADPATAAPSRGPAHERVCWGYAAAPSRPQQRRRRRGGPAERTARAAARPAAA